MGGLAHTPEDKPADGLVGLIGRVEQLQHKPHASEDQIRHILMAEAVGKEKHEKFLEEANHTYIMH